MSAPMEILLSVDSAYLKHVRTLMCSLVVNNPGERFKVHLLHQSLAPGAIEALSADLGRIGCELSPLQVDSALFGSAPTSKRYPQEMYYRLLAPSILPKDCKRVLYLDPDTLVINPVGPLWNINLEDHLFAAAAHTLPTELLHEANKVRLGTEHRYYNSGVLLIDVAAARSQLDPRDVFGYVRERGNTLLLPDQDAFNALYGKRTLEIPDTVWNLDARMLGMHYARGMGEIDINWIMENTAILHFCGKEKPWHKRYHYRLGLLYKHYRNLTKTLMGKR